MTCARSVVVLVSQLGLIVILLHDVKHAKEQVKNHEILHQP
jgi:hypothetical protein